MTMSLRISGCAIVLLCCLSLGFCCSKEPCGDEPVITKLTPGFSELGEAPHWDEVNKVLYYVDITGKTVHRYDPATKEDKCLTLEKTVSLVVTVKGEKNKFVITHGLEVVVLTWDWEKGTHSLCPVAAVEADQPMNRFNDGKADSKGRMWGGPATNGVYPKDKSAFYLVDTTSSGKCKAENKLHPVSMSNGLGWSEDDKTMFYIDSNLGKLEAFDYDLKTASIRNRRTVFDYAKNKTPGSPDGMTLDCDGNIWMASWTGSQVIKVSPKGKLLQTITFPVSQVTSVVFGGDKLDIMYVTSMREGLNETQLKNEPLSGALFEVRNLKVTGTLSKPAIVASCCTK